MEKCINKLGLYFWVILIMEKPLEMELIFSLMALIIKEIFITTKLMIKTVIMSQNI